MKKLKQSIIIFIGTILLFTEGSQQTQAMTNNYETMTQNERTVLLRDLLVQVATLQEQLRVMRNTEVVQSDQVAEIKDADYLLGDSDALIKILTFVDFESPFSKQFHTTLKTIVSEYDEVAVVYRHMPLEQLFPNTKKIAITAECAGQLGGDRTFWKFADVIFDSRGINQQTSMQKLPSFAKKVSLSSSAFATCRTSAVAKTAVETDEKDALARDVNGVPESFVFFDGEMSRIRGSQPYDVVKEIIENLLK